MTIRAVVPVAALLAFLGACSLFGGREEAPRKEPERAELAPAEMPAYGTGDRFTYDNPRETWTVVKIADDLLYWESSLGGSQVTVFDPLLPPVEWTLAGESPAFRKIVEWDGSMFPLTAGNTMTFREAVARSEGEAGPVLHRWRCQAGEPRNVVVPAGRFATYPVFCQREDGFRAEGDYAPSINRAVSISYIEPSGRMFVRTLQSVALGDGQRVAARAQPSLPRGWSEALVDRSSPYARMAARNRAKLKAATASSKLKNAHAEPKNTRRNGGRYLVQLASLKSPVSARNEWRRLRSAHSELLGDRELVLEKRTIAGRGTFYRVQTGRYRTLGEARSVCATLTGKNQGCLTIKR